MNDEANSNLPNNFAQCCFRLLAIVVPAGLYGCANIPAETPAETPPHFDEVVERLQSHRNAYEGFADTLESDTRFDAVSCNNGFFEGIRPGDQLEDYLTDDELRTYTPYCELLGDTSAFETHRGTSFRMLVTTEGELVISSYLERLHNFADRYPICRGFKNARGLCDIPVDATWSVTYRWQPADE